MATAVMPALANAGVVETMSVVRTPQVSDGAGGFTPGATTTPYTNVPVAVKEDVHGQRSDLQGKLIAKPTYILEFPMIQNGSLIAIDLATDKLIVAARSPIPSRTFHIELPINDGVMNYFVCTEET
jgi:hypothetical protein